MARYGHEGTATSARGEEDDRWVPPVMEREGKTIRWAETDGWGQGGSEKGLCGLGRWASSLGFGPVGLGWLFFVLKPFSFSFH